LYEQLRRVLLAQIEEGSPAPGELLPTEVELCLHHDVSRAVVRQALQQLVADGRLHRVRGRGTFVAKPKLHEQFMRSTVGFFDDLTTQGHAVVSRVLRCGLVDPPQGAADALELAAGARCIELVRVRCVDEEVVAVTNSYMPHFSDAFLADLRRADLSRASLYGHLQERWGLRIDVGHRSLEAMLAGEGLAKLLQIQRGDPVLMIESAGRDAVQRPVEYFLSWHRADRARIDIDVVRRPA
jgi:GntR family transcriptional regulator